MKESLFKSPSERLFGVLFTNSFSAQAVTVACQFVYLRTTNGHLPCVYFWTVDRSKPNSNIWSNQGLCQTETAGVSKGRIRNEDGKAAL